MSFTLSELKQYKDIVIQCHDNPDADALASGFALKWYLKKEGIDARFIYGGKFSIKKANLVLMTEKLGIDVEYVKKLDSKPELLVTVDCCYGESNVTKFEAKNIAVIDHHRITGVLPAMSDIRSNYGSCSTIIYEMLSAEGVDINTDSNVATALYYGLMTDTGNFSEIFHPADKDLRDFASFRSADIILFKNSNLSRQELGIAGDALNNAKYNDEHSYGLIEAAPCDPNILGVVSDMLLEVNTIDTCIVYSILPFGVKFSVRSCVKEVKAGEMAAYIAEGLGGGGGHIFKAGGFLNKDLLELAGVKYKKNKLEEFITQRINQYFDESEIIYTSTHEEDISKMEHYVKKETPVGFVKATDLAKVGRTITVRTLEGDVDFPVKKDVYIIIGVDGEIYPIKQAKFEASYKVTDAPYVFPGEYAPAVVDVKTGERIEILPFAKSCTTSDDGGIYARELDHRVKIFTTWDPDKYYLGVPGDFLAVRVDDHKDAYIIARDIFFKTYRKD
ncbi:MAG: DHH family phosphoesterase [Lachnospiraceae bacterium]|nr:DHH family phosphoesterase [Lachnospiraceae bacterium]